MTAIKYKEGGTWKTLTMPSGVHIGPSTPDPAAKQVWVDTDEPEVTWPPPVVIALPATPIDGQEIYYRFVPTQTPATTVPLVWHLRWDATNGAWLPVGDQRPIMAVYYPGAASSMGSGAWGTYDANDPRLTVPLNGTYECETGASEAYAGVAISLAIGLAKNGAVWAEGGASSSAAGFAYPGRLKDVNTLTVSDLIRQYYFLTTAGPQNVVFRGRFTQIRPMRITP